ncbi:MAG: NERD domain-containing protein [Burkholderiales bacterium]|nr:NERD domain-containing protein [Burkholderiales bacterium]
MFIFLLAGYAYRKNRRSLARRPNRCPRPVTAAELRGQAGEASVDAELRRVLTALCGDNYHLHPGAILLRHAPGTAFPTAEVDHLAITPFGLFVVETKNWTGVIDRGPAADVLTRVAADGTRETRKSPDAQNRTKVRYLRGVLPGMWPIEGLGVFASPQCVVASNLPLSVIHIGELAHWLRSKKSVFDASGQSPVNVRLAWEAVRAIAQTDTAAIAAHCKNLRENPSAIVSAINVLGNRCRFSRIRLQ